ncbi:hypothetical protein P2318_12080 [Myxococcaceae bacterium GXIMD 01537]
MGALLCAAPLGCAPSDASGTVTAYVLARDEATGEYALGRHEVENLESLREVRGRDVDLRKGSELSDGFGGIAVDRGSPFALEYTVEADGAIVPGDLHSLYALSLYRNLDRTASFVRAHGHTPLKPLDVFYFPRMDNPVLGDGRSNFTDNAAYTSLVPGFVMLPSLLLTDLPMLLNEGIIAHEFGHAVIHQELFGAAKEAPNVDDEEWTVAHRHLSSMHEGVADLVAWAATGDPDSFSPTADIDRDLREPLDYTQADLDELEAEDVEDYDPHRHGSIMARAVFEVWPDKLEGGRLSPEARGRLMEAILGALRALRFERESFSLASFPDAFLQQLAPGERREACERMQSRLAALRTRFSPCVPQ